MYYRVFHDSVSLRWTTNHLFVDIIIYQAKAWKRKFILFLVLFWCMCQDTFCLTTFHRNISDSNLSFEIMTRPAKNLSLHVFWLVCCIACGLRPAQFTTVVENSKNPFHVGNRVIGYQVSFAAVLESPDMKFLYTFKFWEIIPQPIWNNSLVTI